MLLLLFFMLFAIGIIVAYWLSSASRVKSGCRKPCRLLRDWTLSRTACDKISRMRWSFRRVNTFKKFIRRVEGLGLFEQVWVILR